MRKIAVIALLVCLAGCASTARLITYDGPRVVVPYRNVRLVFQKHKNDNMLLAQAGIGSMGTQNWNISDWRRAFEAFVEPVGCGVPELTAISKLGSTWEATVLCPEGVDLSALMAAQKSEIRRGAPLHR